MHCQCGSMCGALHNRRRELLRLCVRGTGANYSCVLYNALGIEPCVAWDGKSCTHAASRKRQDCFTTTTATTTMTTTITTATTTTNPGYCTAVLCRTIDFHCIRIRCLQTTPLRRKAVIAPSKPFFCFFFGEGGGGVWNHALVLAY